MDLAYDHIVEESLPKEDDGKRSRANTATTASGAHAVEGTAEQTQNSLNAELQDAYKAFSASPWGARIGGFLGTVVKQVCAHTHTHTSTPGEHNSRVLSSTKMGQGRYIANRFVPTHTGRIRLPRSPKGAHRPRQRSPARPDRPTSRPHQPNPRPIPRQPRRRVDHHRSLVHVHRRGKQQQDQRAHHRRSADRVRDGAQPPARRGGQAATRHPARRGRGR